MTRFQLISEIMAQVCSVTDETDFALRLAVEKRLHRTPFAVLREIYATNAVQRAVEIGQIAAKLEIAEGFEKRRGEK